MATVALLEVPDLGPGPIFQAFVHVVDVARWRHVDREQGARALLVAAAQRRQRPPLRAKALVHALRQDQPIGGVAAARDHRRELERAALLPGEHHVLGADVEGVEGAVAQPIASFTQRFGPQSLGGGAVPLLRVEMEGDPNEIARGLVFVVHVTGQPGEVAGRVMTPNRTFRITRLSGPGTAGAALERPPGRADNQCFVGTDRAGAGRSGSATEERPRRPRATLATSEPRASVAADARKTVSGGPRSAQKPPSAMP